MSCRRQGRKKRTEEEFRKQIKREKKNLFSLYLLNRIPFNVATSFLQLREEIEEGGEEEEGEGGGGKERKERENRKKSKER